MRRVSFIIVGSLYLLTACGGSQPPAEAAPPSGEAAETPAPPPTKPFDELSQEEKMAVMKKTVVPNFKKRYIPDDPTLGL